MAERRACQQNALGSREGIWLTWQMDYRTKAEFYIRGITNGFVEASEVIAWADEVIVSAPKTEEWMIDISSCGPEDRMKVLSSLNTVKGEIDVRELNALLKARGVS
ncbi:MAG TPA: hypothetical protein VIM69_07315 [Opitutaceae bacterium]